MRRDSESGRTISQRKGAGKAGLLLRTGMRTTVVRVRCKHRMRHLAVGNKLNRAVVIAELLLGDDVRIVPVDITIHTNDISHDTRNRPQIVRNHYDRHSSVQLGEQRLGSVYETLDNKDGRSDRRQNLRIRKHRPTQ